MLVFFVYGLCYLIKFPYLANLYQLALRKAGTPLAAETERHKIVYRQYAPYEVISTAYISAWELARLKMIEEMLDTYYNRGGFSPSPYALRSVSKEVRREQYDMVFKLE